MSNPIPFTTEKGNESYRTVKVPFGNNYTINEMGEIFNTRTTKKLKPYLSDWGYFKVSVSDYPLKKTYLVHRLIALSFIPNPDNKPEINHIDGNKQNNSIENLEWVTTTENIRHALMFGLMPTGDKHPKVKVTDNEILIIKQMRKDNITYKKISEKFGISVTHACRVAKGKRRGTAY